MAWLDKHRPNGDEVDVVDQIFVIRKHADQAWLPQHLLAAVNPKNLTLSIGAGLPIVGQRYGRSLPGLPALILFNPVTCHISGAGLSQRSC